MFFYVLKNENLLLFFVYSINIAKKAENMNSKNFLMLLFIFIIPFTNNVFAGGAEKIKNGNEISIQSENNNPFNSILFFGSQLPYNSQEKLLFFNFSYNSSYDYKSIQTDRERYEKYNVKTVFGLAGYFVIGDFGAGIEIEFNIPKQKMYRTLYTPLKSYFVNDKKTSFNLKVSVGYKLLNNLGVGFDLYYNTYYKIHEVRQNVGDDLDYNIGEERLNLGISITYQPFSFLRVSYIVMIVMQRMIAHFVWEKTSWPNVTNFIKLSVFPIKDLLEVNAEFSLSPSIGKIYDDIAQTESWKQETVFNVFLNITFWPIKNAFAVHGGFLYEYIMRDKPSYGDAALLKQRDDMHTYLYGFSAGVIWKITNDIKITIDFIFKYNEFSNNNNVNEIAGGTYYNTYSIYINSRFTLP